MGNALTKKEILKEIVKAGKDPLQGFRLSAGSSKRF